MLSYQNASMYKLEYFTMSSQSKKWSPVNTSFNYYIWLIFWFVHMFAQRTLGPSSCQAERANGVLHGFQAWQLLVYHQRYLKYSRWRSLSLFEFACQGGCPQSEEETKFKHVAGYGCIHQPPDLPVQFFLLWHMDHLVRMQKTLRKLETWKSYVIRSGTLTSTMNKSFHASRTFWQQSSTRSA